MAVPRSAGILFVGIAAGLIAGQWFYLGASEGEHGQDLIAAPAAWTAIAWLLLVSWIAAIWVVWFETFRLEARLFAFGWLLGLPATYVVGLVYAWVAFGTFGYLPNP